ncbi:MAG TPA: class I SAM-dependent methyltransferase [Thermoanaerobaculia bacterium]
MGRKPERTEGAVPFIPALSYHVLTPLYDIAVRLTLPERRFKLLMVRAAGLLPSHRVLDIGCGTGTLLQLVAEEEPGALLGGVDADSRILAIARRKLAASAADAQLHEAPAWKLPYETGSIDRILSTLMFHHLGRTEKEATAQECLRVLRDGGRMLVGDFGAPHSRTAAIMSWIVTRVSDEAMRESLRGELPAIITRAGFREVSEIAIVPSVFGTVRIMSATK